MSSSNQGISNDRYTVIPRVLVFIFSAGQVLLLKGSPSKKLWAGQYNGIGGHVEHGEDIFSAAYRELKEEAGLDNISLDLCGMIIIDVTPQTGVGLFIFRGNYDQGVLVPSTEGQLEWIDPAQLNQIPVIEDLHVILPLVMIWKSGSPPFSKFFSPDIN